MTRETDVQLRDGGWIHVRPIRESDAAGILGLHAALSDRARYFRFFSAYPRMPDADLRRFVTVDHRNREALVAVLDEDLIAVCRYERLPTDATDAEVAFLVVDAHQRRGIGPVLLRQLAEAAREEGVTRFVADVLPGNAPMMKVFAGTGSELHHSYADGVIHVAFSINAGE